MATFVTIFQKFPNTCRRFRKILQKPGKLFPNSFRKFPKIHEDNRRFPRSQEDPMIFRWYSNTFKYSLKDLLCNYSNGDLFTCENVIYPFAYENMFSRDFSSVHLTDLFLQFYFSVFFLMLALIEKVYQILKKESKFVKFASHFHLFSRCLEMWWHTAFSRVWCITPTLPSNILFMFLYTNSRWYCIIIHFSLWRS